MKGVDDGKKQNHENKFRKILVFSTPLEEY